MAKLLKDIKVGSIVKLNEGGVPTEFYVAKHDYEAELNGAGRTLLVRRAVYGTKMALSSSSATNYASSTISTWLNGTYLALLDASIQSLFTATKFSHRSSYSSTALATAEKKVFLLSGTELGGKSTAMAVEGEYLPIADLLVPTYVGSTAVTQWTRSLWSNSGVYVTADATGSVASANATTENYFRPAFTLPGATVSVYDDGMIGYGWDGGDSDRGIIADSLAVDYSFVSGDGSNVTYTELLDDTEYLRTYTAASGELQSVNLDCLEMEAGEHSLLVSARVGDLVMDKEYTFRLLDARLIALDEDRGEHKERFRISYTPRSYSGADVSVTEYLDGEAVREYTSVSGEEQTMFVSPEWLTEDEHNVSVQVSCEGDTGVAERKFRFSVHGIALGENGSIQEMQDGNGDPVFPATLAKAVLMADGKSVETILSDSKDKVGDIKVTTRTDLGEDWILCNGVRVSREVYGKLGELIPANLTDEWTKTLPFADDAKSNYVNCITYADGYWVIGGYYISSSSSDYAYVAYATDLSGPWTRTALWGSSSAIPEVKDIVFADGYWVVCGKRYASSTYQACIAYTTDIAGTWTTKSLWSYSESGCSANCITYANGYWCVGGRSYDGSYYKGRIAYTTDPAKTWTTKDVWSYSQSLDCIAYADGYWVVGGSDYQSGVIAYATDLAGTWTKKELWRSTNAVINCITYAEGRWVVGGRYNADDVYYAQLAYTTDPAGEWSRRRIWSGTNYETYINCIAYADGHWLVGGRRCDGTNANATIAYATDLAGSWTDHDLWIVASTSSSYLVNDIAYADGYWVAVGGTTVDSVARGQVASYDTRNILIPTISVDNAYVYIRVKE